MKTRSSERWRRLRRPEVLVVAARAMPWAMALPLLKRVLPLPKLVTLVTVGRRTSNSVPNDVATAVDSVLRLRGGDRNCLERSLIILRYLGKEEFGAELRIGFTFEGGSSLIGHAWITLHGVPLGEPEPPELQYTELVAFSCDGARLR